MKEHLALRFYDELSRKMPEEKVKDITKQLDLAFESNEKLQRRCERLEQKKEDLILEREAIKKLLKLGSDSSAWEGEKK